LQEFFLQPRKPRGEKQVARVGALLPHRSHRQFGKLSRLGRVFGVTLVVNGQLLAGVNALVQIGNHVQPYLGGALVFAAALGHQRKIAARLRTEFRWQANR